MDANDRRLPLAEHLRELRIRLWRSMIAYVVAIFVCWGFWRPLFALLVKPLVVAMQAAHLPVKLIAISPTEPLWVPMKLSMLAAVFCQFSRSAACLANSIMDRPISLNAARANSLSPYCCCSLRILSTIFWRSSALSELSESVAPA